MSTFERFHNRMVKNTHLLKILKQRPKLWERLILVKFQAKDWYEGT